MSHELITAVTLPDQPLVLIVVAAVLAVIMLIVIAIVFRKSRTKKRFATAWREAAGELGIELVNNGSKVGPLARGRVNEHVVTITPVRSKGRKKNPRTVYGIKFEAGEAPSFHLVQRTDPMAPMVETGNPKFDAVVTVQTDQPDQLGRFLTAPRRAAILRLLTYWPSAQITNREARLTTPGLEMDQDKLVDSICHLVASAETFDRPAAAGQPAEAAPTTTADATTAAENPTSYFAEHSANGDGDGDVLTEVRLDEVTVLNDLFNSDLSSPAIATRFHQVYQGRQVTWAGEVVRVGAADDSGAHRIAALIGSADGQNPDSGRVVAITTLGPDQDVTQGDVITFSGALVNLDAEQRLFHLA